MKLIIKSKVEDGFYPWLIKFIRRTLLGKVDYRKLYMFEMTLNENKSLLGLFRRYISGREVFITGVNNIIVTHFDDKDIIQIDPNAIYPGTQTKVITLCKMINFGTLNFEPYPIFTDTFKYVEDNIKYLYIMYKRQQR